MTKSGLIIAHQGIKILVRDDLGTIQQCTIKRNSDFVVGDHVSLEGTHARLLSRSNLLQRQTPYGLQSIAANLDAVGVVIAQNPPFPRLFIDQVVLCARSQNISPFLVLNKIDSLASPTLETYLNETFVSKGLSLFKVSALNNTGIDELKTFISKTGRCILVGVSGVGKSSLMNRLAPQAKQKVASTVDKDRHGQHTTSQSVLFDVGHGQLIDSPGVRDFSPPILKPKEIASHFVGFSEFLHESCKFRNCLHETEPGCVIRMALDEGTLSSERYQVYLEILNVSKAISQKGE